MYSVPNQLFQTYNVGLLTLYNKTLENTIGNMTELSNVVKVLSEDMNRITSGFKMSLDRNVQQGLLYGNSNTPHYQGQTTTGENPLGRQLSDPKNSVDDIKSISAYIKTGADVLESISGLKTYMVKIKGSADVVTNVIDGNEAVQKLVAATDTMSKIKAGLEILTSAIAAGKAASSFGPQMGVLTTIGVLSEDLWAYQKLKSKQQQQHKVSADFMSQGIVGGNDYFSSIQQTHLDAQALTQFAKQKGPAELQKEEDALVAGWIKTGGKILFDDNAAAKNPAYTSALKKALNISQQMKSHPIKEVIFDDEGEQKAFKQNFDPLELFPTSLLPMVQEYFIENNYLMQKKGFRSISQKEQREKSFHGIPIGKLASDKLQDNILTNMIYTYQQYSDRHDSKGGEKYIAAYVDKLQKQYGQQSWFNQRKAIVMEQFGRAKKKVDIKKRSEGQASGYFANNERAGGNTGNTINFNKALIEHFTINVKDSKEGMNDFKRKVEEVLIEILHSVNTIH